MYRKIPMPRDKEVSSADRERFWLDMGMVAFGGLSGSATDVRDKSVCQEKQIVSGDKTRKAPAR